LVWNYTMVIKDSIVYYIINHGDMGHNNAIRTRILVFNFVIYN